MGNNSSKKISEDKLPIYSYKEIKHTESPKGDVLDYLASHIVSNQNRIKELERVSNANADILDIVKRRQKDFEQLTFNKFSIIEKELNNKEPLKNSDKILNKETEINEIEEEFNIFCEFCGGNVDLGANYCTEKRFIYACPKCAEIVKEIFGKKF